MTSQTINKHAKARYAEFEFTLDQVRVALDEIQTLIKKTPDSGTAERFQGWQVPSKDEVWGTVRTASDDLDVFRKKSNEYKTKLIANGWRV